MYSLGVLPLAPSSSRTHVMSACVQFRTAWSGHPRVAAISSLLSPETRCRRTICSSCVSSLAMILSSSRIDYDSWPLLVDIPRVQSAG